MGYCIEMVYSEFKIKKENVDKVFAAIKEMDNGKDYHWVKAGFSKGRTTLEELFHEWSFDISKDAEGTVVEISFEAEKSGSEEELFQKIAPFVEVGYIEFAGEDHERWRYVFDGTSMKEECAVVTWE